MALLRCLLAVALLNLAAGNACAAVAAAVVDDGYAGKALRKILKHYGGAGSQQMEAKLFLDADGKLLDCRAIKGDVTTLCKAARAASPFGEPPYGVDTSIVVAVDGTGKETKKADMPKAASAAPDAKYISKVTRSLREKIYIPEKTSPGTYYANARVQYDAAGKILDCAITRSSGDKLLDRYVLQGIRRAGSIAAPPEGKAGSLDLRFKLVRM